MVDEKNWFSWLCFLVLLGSIGFYTQGCGHILIAGDAEGMRAFGDTMNGAITNGKASPDQDTAYWIARKDQEATNRTPGFWQKLVGGNK